ncbi:T9SS type A sorting domain-containing protein [Larkinella arboricola]|nr:T9SS type A sorting domain-containing protein [Larkinella arboricola]
MLSLLLGLVKIATAQTNAITNGTFSSGLSGWTTTTYSTSNQNFFSYQNFAYTWNDQYPAGTFLAQNVTNGTDAPTVSFRLSWVLATNRTNVEFWYGGVKYAHLANDAAGAITVTKYAGATGTDSFRGGMSTFYTFTFALPAGQSPSAQFLIKVLPTTNSRDDEIGIDDVFVTGNAVLPVTLVDFSALAQQDRTVLVKWTTSWERANKGYVVERSQDLKSFEVAGEVNDVAGSSNGINTYRFVDKSPYRGTSYYRLKQVDADGRTEIFRAQSVVIDGQYGVYPNPVVSQQFTLQLDEPADAVLHLYNTSGIEVPVSKSNFTQQSATISPLRKLSSGVYILHIQERGQTRRHRIIFE